MPRPRALAAKEAECPELQNSLWVNADCKAKPSEDMWSFRQDHKPRRGESFGLANMVARLLGGNGSRNGIVDWKSRDTVIRSAGFRVESTKQWAGWSCPSVPLLKVEKCLHSHRQPAVSLSEVDGSDFRGCQLPERSLFGGFTKKTFSIPSGASFFLQTTFLHLFQVLYRLVTGHIQK